MIHTSALSPFSESVLDYLQDVSKVLMSDRRAKEYPDVITFAFWIRRSSVMKLSQRFQRDDGNIHLGRGIAFHIAPSNVPVNYAYSLVVGLLTGNANIVRVPSKEFPQVEIINQALQSVLDRDCYESMRPYICLVRYGRDKAVNDYFSSIADARIIWGGDATIATIRESKLPPRATEITFADRFSIAVIDSDKYMAVEDKVRVAEDFYNDTYLTDQNACTSPRVVIWTGTKKEDAKSAFWQKLHEVVKQKYTFQPIQGVNKLTSSYLVAAAVDGAKILTNKDNLIVRVKVPVLSDSLMELKDNSGFFFEYDCDDLIELRSLCNDNRCQTAAYLGDISMFSTLIKSGIRGVDRIVPLGQTMDFDLIWDGYDLYERLTRQIACL
ncbi:MAG: hypothetical protein J5636_02135 [Clostridiales bacterium]|nr:hypothetical protein [Clostridiales bacterium]